MKGKWLLWGCTLGIAATLAVWSAPAQAYKFTFDDVVYISSAAEWTAIFNPGPGYNGPGFSAAGYYQVFKTDTGAFWSGLTTNNPPYPTYIFKYAGNGSSFGGASIQNDRNFNGGLQAVESWDKLSFVGGWTSAAVGVGGPTVDKPYTTMVGAYFQFLGPTGIGSPVPFTINSFDLSGTVAGATFEVVDQNGKVLYTSPPYNLSSTPTHVNVGVPHAFKVIFTAGTGIYVDNVEINNPAPTGALLLLLLD